MKLRIITSMTVLSLFLASCNTTGINTQNPGVHVNQGYNNVVVYPSRADLPKGSRIVGNVVAQNKNAFGFKVSPEEILTELKRQSELAGGNGIVHVTPGIAQTRADVVITPSI